MRLLDLFCGAGIHTPGWVAAGIKPENILGVDINPQPSYPYTFVQADALTYSMDAFDIIHASPPCQLFSRAGKLREAQGGKSSSDDLLTPMLDRLRYYVGTWVVENVEGAKDLMPGAVRVCGSHFGLAVRRHRLFMSNMDLVGTTCRHKAQGRPWGVYHVPGDSIPKGGRTCKNVEHGKFAMGVPPEREVTWQELKEGFPPQYSEFIGRQIVEQLCV